MSQTFQDTANLILGNSQTALDPNAKFNEINSNSNSNSNSTITSNSNSTVSSTQITVPDPIKVPENMYQMVVYSISDSIILYTSSCTPNTENLTHSYYNLDPKNNINLNTSCLLNTQFDLQIRTNISKELTNFMSGKILDNNSILNLCQNLNLAKIQSSLAEKIAKDNINSTISGLSKTVVYQFIDGIIQTDSENKEYITTFLNLNTKKKKPNYIFIGICIIGIILILILI